MSSPTPVGGAVISEQSRASEIGTRILARGGSAADAIVATAIAVHTLSMYHSDFGGGGFAIIRNARGEYESLNFRASAPRAATSAFYLNVSTTIGGAGVAVPGELRGLEELHRRYGRLPWKELFTESIQLARDGFEMRRDLQRFVKKELQPALSTNKKGSYMEYDLMYQCFFDNAGEVHDISTEIKRPEYARTLERIANEGSEAFYSGDIAESLVRAVQETRGVMTLEDLKDYKTEWNRPLSARYKDYKLWTIPAPASGAIWLEVMGTLGHFESEGPGTSTDLHRLTESLRLAYGTRTQLGDPDYVHGLDSAQAKWISPEHAAERAALVDDDKTFPPNYYKPPALEIKTDHGTSNITVADADGLVISITTTVGLIFGSRIIVPETGIVLNSTMDDFSVEGRPNNFGYEPSPANYIVGGKRPLSSSCPYIVEDQHGRPVLAGGAAGGSKIISANAQVARNVLDYGMSAAEALRASRLHNQVIPNHTELEKASEHVTANIDGFTDEQASALQAKGHKVEWVEANWATPCAIHFSYNCSGVQWEPAGDPRKDDAGGSVFYTSP